MMRLIRVRVLPGLLFSCGGLFAQPALQITSPTAGATFAPGQTVNVTVEASGGTFAFVTAGGSILPQAAPLTAPPYQFSLQLPSQVATLGDYQVSAAGLSGGQPVFASPVVIYVERPDSPVSVNIQETELNFDQIGQTIPLVIKATYSDGSTAFISHSSQITYAVQSTTSAPVSVSADGQVTALSVGTARILVNNTYSIPVTVNSPITVAPAYWGMYPGQTQRFYATVSPLAVSSSAVTWSTSLGAIDSTGLYTAPSSVSSEQYPIITATSAANPSISGSTSITIYPSAGISVSPSSVTLSPSQTQQFTSTLANNFDSVRWSISPSGSGTVNSAGLYTAPSSIAADQTVTVTAASASLPSSTATATVSLVPPLPTNVASQITTTFTGYQYVRSNGTFVNSVTLTNSGSTAIAGPIQFVFLNLPSGVSVANATGSVPRGTYAGSPYFTVPGSSPLSPGASVIFYPSFSNPANSSITYSVGILSGAY